MFRRFFFGLLFFMIVISSKAQAADQGDRKVTLSASQITLKKVFNAIRSQTGILVMYNQQSTEIDNQRKVDVDFKDAPLTVVLNDLFRNRGLEWTFNENIVIIRKKKEEGDVKKMTDTPDTTSTIPLFLGKVTDASGAPIIGATVQVEGTSHGATTDLDGKFAFTRLSAKASLVVSYVGYQTRVVRVRGSSVNVELAVDVNSLDETVVVAYGKTTKRFNTGNVSTITAEEIQRQPVNNPLLALQGNVPGIFINQSRGLPGSSINILVQGQNSLQSGNDPFYVIDGVPYQSTLQTNLGGILGGGNPLSFINPSDIESISVLKDADATAIYGSRAANGAILITTKKGVAGPTRVNFNLQQGWGKVTRRLDLMNTQQYLQMRHEALRNDGLSVSPNDYDINGTWDTTVSRNWQKELIGGTAQYTNMNVDLSGGSENIQYLIGATYHRETTVFPGDFNDQKSTVHFNLSSTSRNKKFRTQLSGNYLMDNNHLPVDDMTSQATSLPPTAPEMFNPDGSINWKVNDAGTSTYKFNPAAKQFNKYNNKASNLVANAVLSYEFIQGLMLKTSLGYNDLRSDELTTRPSIAVNPNDRPYQLRTSQFGNHRTSSWIIEPQLTYDKTINKHKIGALVGTTIQQLNNDGYLLDAFGFNSDLVMEDIRSAPTVSVNTSIQSVYKYNAVFGKINYNYADKYIVNLTARRDGSSRFGAANRFHNFGAVGAAWIFSGERFVRRKLPFLSFGKLKASYGTTGNDQIGDYTYLDIYDVVTAGIPYQGANGLETKSIPNPYLKWEQTNKLNLGVELGFIRDRVYITGNYFRNRCGNQLIYTDLPTTAGYPFLLQNFNATVQNSGWEFTLATKNIQGKMFSWSTNVNLTLPRNKLVRYDNLENSSDKYRLVIGQPINLTKLYHYVGVDPQEGVYLVADAEGKPTKEPNSLTDATVWISTFPSAYGGFSNSFTYKSFQLDVLFQFVFQKVQNNEFGNRPGRYLVNQLTNQLDRWQQPGDIAGHQRYSTNSKYAKYLGYAQQSDAAYDNAKYARLKNLSLSYQLPLEWIQKAKMQNARVYFQGQNLLTITKFNRLDPETSSIGVLPPLQVWTFGVQVGF